MAQRSLYSRLLYTRPYLCRCKIRRAKEHAHTGVLLGWERVLRGTKVVVHHGGTVRSRCRVGANLPADSREIRGGRP